MLYDMSIKQLFCLQSPKIIIIFETLILGYLVVSCMFTVSGALRVFVGQYMTLKLCNFSPSNFTN